jgi:DNA invertase Pin-like site-specific DNA recombinase
VSHFHSDKIVREFTETKSAKNITDRPVLQEAIDYCIANDCWLVVAKLDRLSRNVDDVRYIHQKLDKRISFCDIPSDGEVDLFTITLFAAFAERERELISLRTRQALKVKMERTGKWQRGNVGFSDGTANKSAVEVIKNKAENNANSMRAYQVIKSKRSDGMTYREIAKLLNDNKFLTPNGCEFSPAQVLRILNR